MGRPGQRPPPRSDVPPPRESSTTDPRPAPRLVPTCGGRGRGDTVIAVPESSRLPWRTVALSTALALAAATVTVVVLSDDDEAVTTADEPAGSIELTPDV